MSTLTVQSNAASCSLFVRWHGLLGGGYEVTRKRFAIKRQSNMSKLYFKREDVLKVVEDAKKAPLEQRRATFGQYLNGGAYGDKGLDPVEGGIDG